MREQRGGSRAGELPAAGDLARLLCDAEPGLTELVDPATRRVVLARARSRSVPRWRRRGDPGLAQTLQPRIWIRRLTGSPHVTLRAPWWRSPTDHTAPWWCRRPDCRAPFLRCRSRSQGRCVGPTGAPAAAGDAGSSRNPPEWGGFLARLETVGHVSDFHRRCLEALAVVFLRPSSCSECSPRSCKV